MNVKTFKNIIKEAVREAVKEEIGLLLLEIKKTEINKYNGTIQENFAFTTNDVDKIALRSSLKSKIEEQFGLPGEEMKNNQLKVDNNGSNPFASFLLDSAKNMTSNDISNLTRL